MDKKNLLEALKQVKNSGKKAFTQKVDLIINLKNINLKKPEDNIDLFTILPSNPGKKIKICALVNKDLLEKAKIFDKAINKEDFNEYQDKKTLKNLAKEFDFFIAQADLMTDVAKVFGKTLGPRNKMPNPKSGAVITQTTNLEELRTKLQKTIRLKTRNEPIIKVLVGNEKMEDDEIANNVMAIYDSLVHSLSEGEGNIKDVILKLTMGPAIRVKK